MTSFVLCHSTTQIGAGGGGGDNNSGDGGIPGSRRQLPDDDEGEINDDHSFIPNMRKRVSKDVGSK